MKKRKINFTTLAFENIRRKTVRSVSMIIIVAFLTAALFIGAFLSISFNKGIKSLSDRMGADIIMLPAGSEARVKNVILKGEPSTLYLPTGFESKLKDFDSIDKISPQMYIATLQSACCSSPIQLMGIDFETDFLVKNWLSKTMVKSLGNDEIIIGSRMQGEIGTTLRFYGKEFKIVGRLSKTGLGFDVTGFINMETARELLVASSKYTKNPVPDADKSTSCIMIKLKSGSDAEVVAFELNNTFTKEGVYSLVSKKFVGGMSSNLIILSKYIIAFILILTILSICILSLVFSMIINERKKELGILRVLGASNKMLSKYILTEAKIISAIGSGMGILISLILIMFLLPLIRSKTDIPFFIPDFKISLILAVVVFILGLFIGPLSSIRSAHKLSKMDIYTSMREND